MLNQLSTIILCLSIVSIFIYSHYGISTVGFISQCLNTLSDHPRAAFHKENNYLYFFTYREVKKKTIQYNICVYNTPPIVTFLNFQIMQNKISIKNEKKVY